MRNFLIAWLASSAAFTIAFVAFMIIWVLLDGNTAVLKGTHRLALVSIGAGLVVQFIFGGVVYFALSRIGLWQLWAVSIPYLLLWAIAWSGIDTIREAYGMIGWFVIACLVAWVFWFAAL
jgi:hypothetical protein